MINLCRFLLENPIQAYKFFHFVKKVFNRLLFYFISYLKSKSFLIPLTVNMPILNKTSQWTRAVECLNDFFFYFLNGQSLKLTTACVQWIFWWWYIFLKQSLRQLGQLFIEFQKGLVSRILAVIIRRKSHFIQRYWIRIFYS